MKTYKGSCHCGKITYEATLDLSKGTGRCNCSFCAKVRNWSTITSPANFKLLTGTSDIADYQFSKESLNHHYFCKNCGTRIYTKGYVKEIGGDFVSVMISTIDNLDDNERAELPVQYYNGRDNAWFNVPTVTKHL